MTPEQLINEARNKAITLRPWYVPFLSRFVFVPREDRQPLSHDQFGRVYYNPSYVGLANQDSLVVLLIQIAEILARGFHWRGRGRDQQVWSFACLLDTASSLQRQGFKLPRESLKPEWFKFPRDKPAEAYYRLLKEIDSISIPFTVQDDRGKPVPTELEMYWSDGNLIISDPNAAIIGNMNDGDSEGLQYLLDPLFLTGIQEDMYDMASEFGIQMIGDMPDWMIRRTSEKDSVLPWHEYIRIFFGEQFAGGESSNASTYALPSLLSPILPAGVILPYYRGRTASIVIIVDTSGSMTSEMLSSAVAEIYAVLKALGIEDGIHVIPCDTTVKTIQKIIPGQRIVLEGGGGTDLAVGFDKAKEILPRPEGIVVITDGYTEWPEEAPEGMETLVVNVSRQWPEPKQKENFPVPAWSTCVEMYPLD